MSDAAVMRVDNRTFVVKDIVLASGEAAVVLDVSIGDSLSASTHMSREQARQLSAMLLEAAGGPLAEVGEWSQASKARLDALVGDPPPPTKREMFAAMAMQGLISNPALRAVPDATAQEATQVIMRGAVRFADALIAELAKLAD